MGEKEEEMQKTAAENVDCHAFKLHDVEEFACLGQNHQQEESISCFLDLASRSILLYLKALRGLHSSRLKILPGLGVFSTQSLTGASHQLGLWPVLALPPLLSSTDSAVQSNFVCPTGLPSVHPGLWKDLLLSMPLSAPLPPPTPLALSNEEVPPGLEKVRRNLPGGQREALFQEEEAVHTKDPGEQTEGDSQKRPVEVGTQGSG